MIAIALAAVLGTLWATGAINPTGPTLPPPATNETGSSQPTWVEVLREPWDTNERAWLVGDSSDEVASYASVVGNGSYDVAMSSSLPGRTYWSLIPFVPGAASFYLEVGATNTSADTACGLALSTSSGDVTVVGLGAGEVVVQRIAGGAAVELARLTAPVATAANTQIAVLSEEGRGYIYIDDEPVGSFDAPGLAETGLVGVSVGIELQSSCAFDFLSVHTR
jgi:hypothetical protein